MASCTPSCACSTPPAAAEGTRLLLHSATAHTIGLARRVALSHGATSSGDDPHVAELASADLAGLIGELHDALTATERAECRALVIDTTGEPPVARALGAPTFEELAARSRYARLLDLVNHPDRFYARFQPIVRLHDRAVVGHEALLRATDTDGTELGAPDLVSAARTGGWTNALDRIGREVAIRDAAPWIGDAALYINFLPTSVYRPEVCLATTFAAADQHGLDMRQVTFEVVETDRTDDVAHLRRVVDHYRERGARVALDDVGSGYSSLELVAALRPDVVKLEQRLVRALPDDTAVAIIRATIALSHDIGASTIAEGVETTEQAQWVAQLGADLAQGWLFGRPQRPSTPPAPDEEARGV